MVHARFCEICVMIDTTAQLILENDRVQLRPLLLDDLPYFLPFAEHEPTLWTYALEPVAGPENMRKYVQHAVNEREAGRQYPFIVFDKQAGQYAGCTRFYDIQNAFGSTQLGYTWYGSAFQRTGLNRHCKLLLLDYAFGPADLERVEFRADAQNAPSIAAMKAIGCQPEGILRSHMPKPDGSRRDSIVLSILRHEWQAGGRAHLLAQLR